MPNFASRSFYWACYVHNIFNDLDFYFQVTVASNNQKLYFLAYSVKLLNTCTWSGQYLFWLESLVKWTMCLPGWKINTLLTFVSLVIWSHVQGHNTVMVLFLFWLWVIWASFLHVLYAMQSYNKIACFLFLLSCVLKENQSTFFIKVAFILLLTCELCSWVWAEKKVLCKNKLLPMRFLFSQLCLAGFTQRATLDPDLNEIHVLSVSCFVLDQ